MPGKILLIGCGKMGGAMLRGWRSQGLPAEDIVAVDPEPDTLAPLAEDGLTTAETVRGLPEDLVPEILIVAVKPQTADLVLPDYATLVERHRPLVISIAAGKTLAFFARHLGRLTPVIRAMPNTPAAIRAGMIVCCANDQVSPAQRQAADTLLAANGTVSWVDDEAMMDAVTAVSGSGPAYVFHLVEAMAAAGTEAGLPPHLAMRLARETVGGSGVLLREDPTDVATLRQNVTSPGGVTAAAMKILGDGASGLAPLMRRAVLTGAQRSRELARD